MSTPDPAPGIPKLLQPAPWKGWLVLVLAMVGTFILGLLVASVTERRQEANLRPQQLVHIADLEPDSARWGKNYPREYEAWRQTAQGGKTKYGGSEPFSQLELDPNLKFLFHGYPFEIQYNEERGHIYAIEDVLATRRADPERGGKPQPGTCMTCKSSEVPRKMLEMGVEKFYSTPFATLKTQFSVDHPIGCADCHDAETMELRITRPALREAFTAMGRDIDKASHQEMRSLVCAQCHVEYYFAKTDATQKKGTYLTFPWKHGTTVEAMERYYTREKRHVDWVHPTSGTEMIKMQHPDYELYRTGIHAANDVACADCHMPYRSEGGVKYTDHHIESPLKMADSSCGVCHRWTNEEVKQRVETIQDRNKEMMDRAETALVAAHKEVGAAMTAGANDGQLKPARELLRRAQLRWDYIAASNGMGFHSPQEAARILASAIDLAQQARLAVAKER